MKLNYTIVTSVENTPFTIIQDHEDKYAITIANNVVSKPQESKEDCIKLIENRDWELLTNSICALVHIVQNVDEYESKNEESTDGNS